eukprot:Lankesteria_metandrocarpae@DN5259_c2_g1_i1.p1
MNRLSKYTNIFTRPVGGKLAEYFSVRSNTEHPVIINGFKPRCYDMFRQVYQSKQGSDVHESDAAFPELFKPSAVIQNLFCAVWPTELYIFRRLNGSFSVVLLNSSSSDAACTNMSKENTEYALHYALRVTQYGVLPQRLAEDVVSATLPTFLQTNSGWDMVNWSDVLPGERFPRCQSKTENYKLWEIIHKFNVTEIRFQKKRGKGSAPGMYTLK